MLTSEQDIQSYNLGTQDSNLLVIEPRDPSFDYTAWIKRNLIALEESLMVYGGILFRNFGIHAISEFNKFVLMICPDLLEYIYRSTPRTRLGGKIYTATEYPKHRVIPLHNENSYSLKWPKKIFFFCALKSNQGGETPIADSRIIYQMIDPEIREEFERKGVMYVRNYTPGIDLNWQEVFQTDNKSEVNEFCLKHNIKATWNQEGPELTTSQVCQATLVHHVTGEKSWFNQIHLFHPLALDDEERAFLLNELSENALPRQVFYGDGTPIDKDVFQHIWQVFERAKFKFDWQKGDVLMLDNILKAHGREAYEGERKIAVAMA